MDRLMKSSDVTNKDMEQRMDKNQLDDQEQHWDKTFAAKPEMFGDSPSLCAKGAARLFAEEDRTEILELGCGQGRDTLFFLKEGFHMTVADYAPAGLQALKQKTDALGFTSNICFTLHDLRKPLPFPDQSFDACYSHMLFCMALKEEELGFLSEEIRRVLKPGGLNIYTVRHKGDAHYGQGIHRGEDMYEMGGFIVHYYDRQKVERLARGYDLADVSEFEEGGLPRKLFQVTLRKK